MTKINLLNFPTTKIYVLLSTDFRKKIIEDSIIELNLNNYFELSKWINTRIKPNTKFNGGDIKRWVKGKNIDNRTDKEHPKFMPLWVIKELCFLLKIKNVELHQNVIGYRSGSSGLTITKPILPIKTTPNFSSIVVHLFCDGHMGNSPAYYQKNKTDRDLFIQKLKKTFGQFKENIYEKKWQIRFPKAITDILVKYYTIHSFLSRDAKLPKKMFRESKLNKLACLTAFILDEGHIRDVIIIYSTNKELLAQMKQLAESIGYNCKEVLWNKSSQSYSLTFSNKYAKQMLKDINKLSQKYPSCSLGTKLGELTHIVKCKSQNNPRDYKKTDELILNQISKRELSTKQISKNICYAQCTVLHHLEKMYKEGKVSYKKDGRKYLWRKA